MKRVVMFIPLTEKAKGLKKKLEKKGLKVDVKERPTCHYQPRYTR